MLRYIETLIELADKLFKDARGKGSKLSALTLRHELLPGLGIDVSAKCLKLLLHCTAGHFRNEVSGRADSMLEQCQKLEQVLCGGKRRGSKMKVETGLTDVTALVEQLHAQLATVKEIASKIDEANKNTAASKSDDDSESQTSDSAR